MSLIGKQIGNYQIKAKLGEGGMGTVYLGEHPLIGKRVAVKVLLEELATKEDIVTRFFNEAKAVNDIGHQNIVDFIDFGKMKSDAGADLVYFIMEYLDGESLAARLRRTGLAFNETMHVMAQCCSGLAASHGKGIVHRDLKPENLYMCTRGGDKNFLKILDFGIAKLTGDGGSSSHKTRTGLVIGTPTYMSPEQCEGKGLIDARSDIYSLGVVMYELLTGRVPFPGEGFGEILVAHLTKEPEPPSRLNPDIGPDLEAIVMHAIEKDRNRRFQTMEEFSAAIANTTAHLASYQRLPAYAPGAQGMSGARPIVGGTGTMPIAGAVGAQMTGQGPTTSSGVRSTTLSGSAAELEDAGPKKSRGALLVAAAAVIAVAAVGAVFVANKKNTVTPVAAVMPVEQPTPKPSLPPPVEKVKVTVASEPVGADVVRAGQVLGVTPFDIDVKKGEPAFDVEVRKAGFVTGKRTVKTDESREIFLNLQAEPAAVVAQAPAGNATVKKSSSHSPHKADPAHVKPATAAKPLPGGDDDMRILIPNL